MMKHVACLGCAAVLVCAVFAFPAEAQEGLVAHWRFDEGSGTTVSDASGNQHDGENLGALYVDSTIGAGTGSGVCTGTALQFGGDDRVRFGNSSDFHSDELTVMAWVFSLNWSAQSQPMLVAKGINQEWILWKSDDPGQNEKFGFRIGTLITAYSTTTVQNNKWYHVVGRYSRQEGKLQLFVNGTLERSLSFGGAVPSSDRELDIGAGNRGTVSSPTLSNFFSGIIDEVYIFDRALSAQEILEYYDAYARPDNDGDCIAVVDDNCPDTANENQSDIDLDGVGDACDCRPTDNQYPDENGECPSACAATLVPVRGGVLAVFLPFLLLWGLLRSRSLFG